MRAVVVPDWVPGVLRFGVVGLVAPPAVGKFLRHGESVALFAALGIPAPELTVPLVGVVELGAVVLLLLDEARLVAALALLPVMVVAAWTSGEWQAVAVIVGIAGLVAVEFDALVVADTTGFAD